MFICTAKRYSEKHPPQFPSQSQSNPNPIHMGTPSRKKSVCFFIIFINGFDPPHPLFIQVRAVFDRLSNGFRQFSVIFPPVLGRPTEQIKSCPNFFINGFDPPPFSFINVIKNKHFFVRASLRSEMENHLKIVKKILQKRQRQRQ